MAEAAAIPEAFATAYLNLFMEGKIKEGESVYTTSDIKEEIVDNISYLYYYDSKGNITEIKRGSRTNADTNDSATSGYTDYLSYEYDSLNQLTRENNKETNETTVYSYDNAGNITSKKIYAYTVSAEIETELKDTVNYGYGTSGGAGWSKLLTSYNGESIVYNTAGNPTTYRGANLDWYGRELTSYTKGNNTLSFTYDADGLRATKKVNGVTSQYKYDDEHVTYERRGTTDIYYWYDGNGHLFAIRCYFADGTNVLYYATTNLRGDVLGLYTGGGDQQVWYEYDAWGNTTITDTSTSGIGSINPIRYRGYYYDNETGFYYVSSRYYDPVTGQWISPEPNVYYCEFDEGAGLLGYNVYAYCANNPVNFYDPTGEAILTCILIGAGIGLIAGGAFGAYRANKNRYSPSDGWKYWRYVVGYGVAGGAIGALVGWGAGALIAKYGVATAATSITKGGGARFSSFNALKRSLGSAGRGKQWHHIVEQCQIGKSRFPKYWIQNSNNVINISNSVHSKISAHYSRKFAFTQGKTVRGWLAGQSFQKQYEYGIKILRQFGVKI